MQLGRARLVFALLPSHGGREISSTVGEKGVLELLSSHQQSRVFLGGTHRKACGDPKAGTDTDNKTSKKQAGIA